MADTSLPIEEVTDGNKIFRFRGWKIETQKKAALSTDGRTRLSQDCELPHIPLPEIIFADNFVRITHEESGWTAEFNARDALKLWAQRERQGVPSTIASYDVMYTCEYQGTVAESWKPIATQEELPLAKLREHSTILFYDHVSLFEDDIRDLGEVELTVKIRVMPFGFLLLCRYFARMDDKIVKLRDSRYYHEFGSNVVLRDFELREATTKDLHQFYLQSHFDDPDDHNCFIPTADIMYEHTKPTLRSADSIALRH
ncbi:Aste57867_13107 [Aphanomyces stellatus]|uniref:Aste57867_13107 protein n=1 Tax=Aphanomyces stellatus TaxID=120398 RepID=A0A485KXA3_9STRA|nr:hypothetical protein As57867_013059 [Aphanomyces stellatus]VFT89951.1 Aste57867_13107 [Aphanomyces stellatus]